MRAPIQQYATRFVLLCVFLVSLLFPSLGLASTVDGTIDTTYKYAWSERLGWINVGTTQGNVHVVDTALSGYMWNEHTGWINLAVSSTTFVANNAEGTLSGYAWGEGIGYINFTGVTIDASGFFHGYATSTLSGAISFNCENSNTCGASDFRTKTDWRKASVRSATPPPPPPPPPASSGGGGGGSGWAVPSTPTVVAANATLATPSVPATPPTPFSGTSNIIVALNLGAFDPQVKLLQSFLNTNGYPVSGSGTGSLGNEGTFFGVHTSKALRKFQLAHEKDGLTSELGVLGPKTLAFINARSCGPLLTTYMKQGRANSALEVRKLQKFLTMYEGFPLLRETGIFDNDTFTAVVAFQTKYTSDILGPWQASRPTGYVYKTTKKKINDLYCGYVRKSETI